MPLSVFALLAYLGGLLAGFSDSVVVSIGAVASSAALVSRRGRLVAIAFAALATGGVVAARTAARDAELCSTDALRLGAAKIVLDDSASTGAFTRGHVAGCQAFASFSVQSGNAAAGSTVVVRATWSRSARGLASKDARVELVKGPGLLPRWRATVGRMIERTFRGDAPLVKALLIADWRELSPELRDRWSAAGLSHMLSIGGMHIAIIATAIELALELFGVARRRASIATIVVALFYVALIGAPVPAVRSLLMSASVLVARLIQRPTARWSIVGIGAMHPIVDPSVIVDAGYQLSVIGVAAIIAAGQLGKRIGIERLPTIPRALVAGLLGTTIATIASAPIIAWIFGRISMIAPLTNLVANPLIALAQPMIFCGMVLAPIAPIARWFADAAHPLLAGLDRVAATGASVPHATIQIAPTMSAAIVACVMAGSVIVACASRDWIRPAASALSAAVLLLWLPVTPTRRGLVELHMIDVGQGDAIALRTPHSRWILFDAGGAWRGGDAGRSMVIPYIARRGGTVEMFVLSHPHTDHVGGASALLRAFKPAAYVDAGFPGGAESYRMSLDAARAMRVRWRRAHPGDSVVIDGVTITFLAPDSAWTASLTDPNLASVIARVTYGDVRMLLVGDAERAEEEWLLARDRDALRADILKVGHHGSSTSSTEEFLDAVRPSLALVSVGAGNTYHLPKVEVLQRIARYGAQVLRTDHLGTIVARTDGARLFIEAAGDRWELPRESLRRSAGPSDGSLPQ
ncbi:MAG TPA: DNA internalization-related competence protein ComEC/Rec2 [Gemmatimonadaceae bacterium]